MTVPNLAGANAEPARARGRPGGRMSADRLTLLAVDDEQTPARGPGPAAARARRRCARSSARSTAAMPWPRLPASAYDAIFLDVRMPDLDGLELARVLRRFATPPQLVFVSAYDEAAVEAFELHALDYLRKPVAAGGSRRRSSGCRGRVDAAPARPSTPPARAPPPAAEERDGRRGQPARRLDPAAGSRLDPVRAVLRRLRPDRDRRRALSAARHAVRHRAALGAVRVRPRAPPVRGQPAHAPPSCARCSAAPPS